MANIFSYPNKAEYRASNERPNSQSSVSYDGSENLHDGFNIIVPYVPSNCEVGDMVLFDTFDNKHKILKTKTYNAGTFDTSRYIMSRGLYFGAMNGKGLFVAIENAPGGSLMWAEKCYFRLTDFNLANAGSITFNTYYSWAAHNGNVVNWNDGANLDSIVASMNGLGLSASNFKAEALADGTGIGVWVNYPTTDNISAIFSITAQSGNVAVEYMNKYNGNDVVWQYANTGTLIHGRKKAGNVVRRNGLSASWGGCHFARFLEYYGANGSATYVNEANSEPMKRVCFEGLKDSSVAEQVALYNKYNGVYEDYMRGQMVNLNTARGEIGQSYDENDVQTRLLGEVYTQDFNRKTIPAFPSANQALKYGVNAGVSTGFEAGKWGLPTATQMMQIMALVGYNSASKTDFNKAMAKYNDAGNIYGNGQYYWTCAEYSAGSAFSYDGSYGILYNRIKYGTISCRAVLALDF